MKRQRLPIGLIAVAALVWLGDRTYAQPATQPDELAYAAGLTLSPPPAPESVDEELIDAVSRPAGILPIGPVSLLDPAVKQLNEQLDQYGLKIGFSYTALYQAATGGPGQRQAAGGDADLFGNWRLLGPKDGQNNGYLYFAGEYRHDMGTGIAPGGLGGQVGSLWGTTNGFGEQPMTLKEIYWEQHFSGDKLILRVGKLDPENYYNNNYWQSDSKYFVNKAFSSFPVRAFPGQGLGVNLTAKLSDEWYISTGFQDAQGKKTTSGFDTFFGDFNLFGAFEVGYTPTIADLGKGTYRLTGWYRDAGETDGKPHDGGVDLSFDQHVGKHWIPFFRYGWSEGNVSGIEHMVSGGIGWEGKLISETDVIGIGGMWGRPADHSLRDQYGGEVFYRLQISPDNQITVGYQLIVDPSNQSRDDVVGVFELRWRTAI
jgi:porin